MVLLHPFISGNYPLNNDQREGMHGHQHTIQQKIYTLSRGCRLYQSLVR